MKYMTKETKLYEQNNKHRENETKRNKTKTTKVQNVKWNLKDTNKTEKLKQTT